MKLQEPGTVELISQHAELRERAARLAQLVRGEGVPGELGMELEALEKLLARHFEMEELGGYMSFVREAAPQEEETLRRLRGEHDEIWGRLRQLRTLKDGGATMSEIAERVQQWLAIVGGHEAAEHELIERHAPAG